MTKDTTSFFEGIEEEMAATARSEWLGKASLRIGLADAALDAIDRFIGVGRDDVLVCETTCIDYALHAVSGEGGVRELWLVPPHLASYAGSSAELLDDFESRLQSSFPDLLGSLKDHGSVFKGLTTSVPDEPFKLLITDKFEWMDIPFGPQLEWPLYNSLWSDMLDTDGATGAVIYPLIKENESPSGELSSGLPTNHAGSAYYTGGFTGVAELPGGHVMLALGKPKGTLHVEDLSNPNNPWARDVAPVTIAANNGNLVPSFLRSGIEVAREATLGDLASRISRGTTLSEKSLDIKKRANPRSPESFYLVSYGGGGSSVLNSGVGGTAPSYGGYYKYPGDLYYIDGSCFQDGTIRPKVLNSMPKGQERYIVDSHDGEVLLVSRSSREAAIYKKISNPTLIGNSVFVIRLDKGISMDYLACWMRGKFAKAWMDEEGKLLSKRALESLPVPILDDETMEQTVRYEQSIDKMVFDLYREIAGLKASDRFNPLAASGIELPPEPSDTRSVYPLEAIGAVTVYDEDIPF